MESRTCKKEKEKKEEVGELDVRGEEEEEGRRGEFELSWSLVGNQL